MTFYQERTFFLSPSNDKSTFAEQLFLDAGRHITKSKRSYENFLAYLYFIIDIVTDCLSLLVKLTRSYLQILHLPKSIGLIYPWFMLLLKLSWYIWEINYLSHIACQIPLVPGNPFSMCDLISVQKVLMEYHILAKYFD